MTLYTHGTREYAEAVAKSLDREGKLFQRRIVSACDTVELSQRGAKCLSRIFPCGTKNGFVVCYYRRQFGYLRGLTFISRDEGTDMALIVDDRFDVWSDKGQVSVRVLFQTTNLDRKPVQFCTIHSCLADCSYLFYTLGTKPSTCATVSLLGCLT